MVILKTESTLSPCHVVNALHLIWWSDTRAPIQYKDDILPVYIGNLIVEIRRSYDHLISTMGFPILVRWHFYIESGPSTWNLLVFDLQMASCILVNINSGNDLLPVQCQGITWTTDKLYSNEHLWTKFSGNLIKMYWIYWRKCTLKCFLQNDNHFVGNSLWLSDTIWW